MKLSPLDEHGKPVDWWFLYKVPKLSAGPSSDGATGYEYVYYDPHAAKIGKSAFRLDRNEGALNLTLNALFEHPAATTGWILYNDEMPASVNRGDNGNLGPTKGVIALDTETKTAFWLLHSWPKYADPTAKAEPTPMYGQTFMCIALDLATAGKIALQMANHQEPQTYEPHLPASLAKSDPLYRLTQPIDPNAEGDSDSLDYKSAGGLPFKVIAKNRKWGKDFWNDLVGVVLKEDMDVESWIRGPIPPTVDADGIHKTYDIKFVDLRELNIGADWTWPETHDHAKWGLTQDGNWVCVGDMNRMISQEKRGGGTIAFQDPTLWEALKQTDLIVLPPGVTKDQALATIKATHGASKGKPSKRPARFVQAKAGAKAKA